MSEYVRTDAGPFSWMSAVFTQLPADFDRANSRDYLTHLLTGLKRPRLAMHEVERATLQIPSAINFDADVGPRRAGSCRARHRLGGDHAGGRLEIDADATAIYGEDQCGKVGDSESGGRDRPR
jgi:hypothetical protein